MDERTLLAVKRLTENERECLRRHLCHQTAKEMAVELGVSPHAVEKRLKMARTKLGVSSSLEAARLLAAAEEYGRLVPQLPDLPASLDDQPGEAVVAPLNGHRWLFVLIVGASAMMLLALALFMSNQPLQSSPAPAPSTLPSAEPVETVVFRPASADEIHAFVVDAFNTMDKDHSGFLERAEAPQQGVSVGSTSPVKPAGDKVTLVTGTMGQAMYISIADTDGDGRISEAEFVAWDTPIFANRGVPANWRGMKAAAEASRR